MPSTVTRITVALVMTLGLSEAQSRGHAAGATPVHQINVVARKFQFEPGTIIVTAGESVRLTIHSDDVVHGLAIPQRNVDVRIPGNGRSVTVDFIAPAAGRYEIEAIRSNPDYAETHNNLGQVLTAQGQLDDAIQHLRGRRPCQRR